MTQLRTTDPGKYEDALVVVQEVRAQSKFGVIFRGQRISCDGENLHNQLVVRVMHRDLAVPVMPGQWWRVSGHVKPRRFINNFGYEMTEDQMKVKQEDARMIMPSGVHIVDYLSRNPRFQGIGKITAERLWNTFQESLFNILSSRDTSSLCKIVSAHKAAVLVEVWQEEGLSNTLQWLQAQGIGLRIGRWLIAYFGTEASSKIEENPYRLLSFSAGWPEVDALARTLHIDLDDERRIEAAVEETVFRQFSRGNTIVNRNDLFAGLRNLLRGEQHSQESIETSIERCRESGRLLFDQDGNACSLGASILEKNVADCIRLRQRKKDVSCDVDRIIRAYEDRTGHGHKLNKEQREAVHVVAENTFALVTGGPGAGKTTILKCVCEVLDAQGYNTTLLALAGKAVKRVMEATARPACTLARFITLMTKLGELDKGKRSRRKALVIDEASMVDLITFSAVASLIDGDTKIILVGDPDQLPPIGPGLILHCLVGLRNIPHVELKVPLRHGDEIVEIANSVKKGVLPEVGNFNKSVRFIEAQEDVMGKLGASLYLKDPEDTIVLCATRRIAHQININVQEQFQKRNKPLRLFNVEIDQWEHIGFYEGDSLLCTQNHWPLGIQNGSLGKLVEVFDEPTRLDSDVEGAPPALGWIEWDDGEIRALREDLLDSLELGYALTIYKSQGSQWRRVVVCLPNSLGSHQSLLDRSTIYTAITRAQKEVVICGHHEHLVQAVRREKLADRRKVGLPKLLAAACAI